MVEQTINVTTDLESRPAAMFVQNASKFISHIKVRIENKTVNAKSIMGVISLGICNGQSVTIIADGEDEKQAIASLESFLCDKEKTA